MKTKKSSNTPDNIQADKIPRRKFLGGIATACAIPCLGMQTLFAMSNDFTNLQDQDTDQKPKSKFDNPYPRKLTYGQVFSMRYNEFIDLAKALEKEMGKEKLIEFLKEKTKKDMFEYGEAQAKKAKNNSLNSYVEQFRGENYKDLLTMEVITDNGKEFELKVTECIWASTFLKQKAAAIGFAAVCYGDYWWPKGFNSDIQFERDKTLMQGHDCCNHKYSVEV